MPTDIENLLKQSPIYTVLPFDLHCHSTRSDGTFSPAEVVQKAFDNGVKVLALTDHDTILGLAEAKQTAKKLGMLLINGVEISCRHRIVGGYSKKPSQAEKVIHVLGYGFDNLDKMGDRLLAIQQSRQTRGKAMCEKVAKTCQVDFDEFWQAVLTEAKGNPQAVGRMHIANVMVKKGFVSDVQKAFSRYLGDHKSCYVALDTLCLKDCVDLIHACGGKASLAHATCYNLTANKIRKLIADFKQAGGDAIELPQTNEAQSTRHMIDRCIKEHQLLVSVGSDFHGITSPWRILGRVPKLHDGQIGIWQKL
ncbi:PHP-like protein [Moraxella macacae 0408225]|uniref:PHP-like protein n=1 Tax=Moraxella macacae 0408225 TaxID=1230338 RepID=L2F651_9GAMM|nr:PHP domain-containing protein [Moraxella macacae]ELA08385.1 PHP-like protein [Moraxella macacae 0408225]